VQEISDSWMSRAFLTGFPGFSRALLFTLQAVVYGKPKTTGWEFESLVELNK
jgi:hypothetical protein